MIRTLSTVVFPTLLAAIAWNAGAQPAASGEGGDAPPVEETLRPLVHGGFEFGQAHEDGAPAPVGWQVEPPASGTATLDKESKLGGKSALKVSSKEALVRVLSDPLDIGTGLQEISASVMVRGETVMAKLRWRAGEETLREDAFDAFPPADNGWRRLALNGAQPPEGATSAVVLLESASRPTWWDMAEVQASYLRPRALRVFVNQVGYDRGMPKRFTLATNFFPKEYALFSLLDDLDEVVFEGELTGGDRIQDSFGNDWGAHYWRGDFTDFNEPGHYRLQVEVDQETALSPPFQIATDLIWNATIPPAFEAFARQRCGTAVEGVHAACHLDDAAGAHTLAGGWHEGSTYSKADNAQYLWDLAMAYGLARWRFAVGEDEDPATHPFVQEMLWGADFLARSVLDDGSIALPPVSDDSYWGLPEDETGKQPNTGDKRHTAAFGHADAGLYPAALARMAHYFPENTLLVESADRALRYQTAHNLNGPLQFCAAVELWLGVKNRAHAELAQKLFPGPQLEYAEDLIFHESEFDQLVTYDLMIAFQKEAEKLIARADNPFGVVATGGQGQALFATPSDGEHAGGGNIPAVLKGARTMAQAYRLLPQVEFQVFLYDQINWILGCNPFGISLMEGIGAEFLPSYYHHGLEAGLPRSSLHGLIANGIASKGLGDGRPYLDLSGDARPNPDTNSLSLRNNALYIHTLASFKRMRLSAGDESKQ